jgi:glycosyltransferase involved in cell wall biosynthesis
MSAPTMVHLPTLGDHYSPKTGSAVMTIVYEVARVHEFHGGRTDVIVTRESLHDYEVGHCIEISADVSPPAKWQRVMDLGLGRLGLGRPYAASRFATAVAGLDRQFDGTIFLHNNPTAVATFRRAFPNAKVVLWAHNELFASYSRGELRRLIGMCDHVVCVSRFLADRVCQRLGRDDARVHGVVNGVDVERFRPAATPPAGDPIVLFVGRVVPEKGPHLLIEAAKKVQASGRRMVTRIVGSVGFDPNIDQTPYERELRQQAAPLGELVQFHPAVDRHRVLAEYQSASIFCAPSCWDEPCSLTVPEAMACGLPTLASRRGGLTEAGGDAAIYFDPTNANQLADRLIELLDDPARRAAASAASRRHAEQLAWPKHYGRLCAAIDISVGDDSGEHATALRSRG